MPFLFKRNLTEFVVGATFLLYFLLNFNHLNNCIIYLSKVGLSHCDMCIG